MAAVSIHTQDPISPARGHDSMNVEASPYQYPANNEIFQTRTDSLLHSSIYSPHHHQSRSTPGPYSPSSRTGLSYSPKVHQTDGLVDSGIDTASKSNGSILERPYDHLQNHYSSTGIQFDRTSDTVGQQYKVDDVQTRHARSQSTSSHLAPSRYQVSTPLRQQQSRFSQSPYIPSPQNVNLGSAASPAQSSPSAMIPPPPKVGEMFNKAVHAPMSNTAPNSAATSPITQLAAFPASPASRRGSTARAQRALATSITGSPKASPPKVPFLDYSNSRNSSRQVSPCRSPYRPATPLATAAALSLSPESSGHVLEHPPGYVQNPYATEMTPEQRLALEMEIANTNTNTSSLYADTLGFIESRPRAGSTTSSLLTDVVGDSWQGAKKWVQQIGEEMSEKVNEMVRESKTL